MIRTSLVGHLPVIEYRSDVGRYFVTYPTLNLELAMGFELPQTANEVAENAYYGTPFFTLIPAVYYGTPYPRPGMVMPSMGRLNLTFITR